MKIRRLLFALLLFALAHGSGAAAGEWTNRLFPSGMVEVLAVDPRDPLTVYASGCGGWLADISPSCGTFKSVDGGATWTQILDQPASALAIHPTEPSVLYAGQFGAGVFRSLDGGASWVAVNSGISCLYVRTVAIDLANPATVFAGSSHLFTREQCGVVYRSRDAGSTWEAVRGGWPYRIAVHPPDHVVELELGLFSGVCCLLSISADGAMTWEGIESPFIATVVVPDPRMPGRIYAGSRDGGVYVSVDEGEHWQAAGLDHLDVTALALDPANSSVLYAGTRTAGVFRSVSAGQSWSEMNMGLTNLSILTVAVSSTGTRLYAGTEGGGLFEYGFGRPGPVIERNRPRVRQIPPRRS